MVKMRCLFPAFSVLALLVVSVGCGGTGAANLPDTYAGSGTVSYKGEPLKTGTIMLQGKDDIAAGRPPATAEIVNGKYETRMYKGEKSVKISSFITDGEKDATGEAPMTDIIPPKYNTDSELKTTVAEGENTADFTLE